MRKEFIVDITSLVSAIALLSAEKGLLTWPPESLDNFYRRVSEIDRYGHIGLPQLPQRCRLLPALA